MDQSKPSDLMRELNTRAEQETFDFDDELLHDAIAWPHLGRKSRFDSGYSKSKVGDAYIFLVVCAREAFNLRRYPSFEDRLLSKELHWSIGQKRSFSDQDIATGTAEMMRLWRFTQRVLPEDTLNLHRNIRVEFSGQSGGPMNYAANILAAKRWAEKRGDTEVCFEMDTINGFTAHGNQNYGEVQIRMTIPKTDVLYYGNTIDKAETGEWVVLNRDPRGMVSLPLDNISCSQEFELYPQSAKFPDPDRMPYIPQENFFQGRFKPKRFTKLGMSLDRIVSSFR
jgi:hypothetical protein